MVKPALIPSASRSDQHRDTNKRQAQAWKPAPLPAWALRLHTPSSPPLPSPSISAKQGAGERVCTHIQGLASLFTTRGPECNHQLSGIFQEGYVHACMHTRTPTAYPRSYMHPFPKHTSTYIHDCIHMYTYICI